MTKRNETQAAGTLLDLWRPPPNAGEAIGCLATTYTFQPELFDEQCLARFLEVESDPDREDLAYLLERETRLGAVYAGVLVDHTQAGVAHSLRWDVLPVRIPKAKQHAKLSLLAWNNHVRILVASANLTEPGYRLNQEICLALESTPDEAYRDLIQQACEFLERLLAFVPGAGPEAVEVQRARRFLDQLQICVAAWKPVKNEKGQRQQLAFTLPGRSDNPATGGAGFGGQSSLEAAVEACRRRGGRPDEARIASPFFDVHDQRDAATEFLSKRMARGVPRRLCFSLPALGNHDQTSWRLAAPPSLLQTAEQFRAWTRIEVLPDQDPDGNTRPWHAKMLGLIRNPGKRYTSLMIGSSNFTRAGMGIGSVVNAEANLLTIAEHLPYKRLPSQLDEVWPEMQEVRDVTRVEWLGTQAELVEEQRADAVAVPESFLSATYRAGTPRVLIVKLHPAHLPEFWSIWSPDPGASELLTSAAWKHQNGPAVVTIPWESSVPPERLVIRWREGEAQVLEAFLPLNVEDARQLPPPADLAQMTADDILLVLAATDPSAALRAWGRKRSRETLFDEELDSALPPELDPLRRYELKATFLRRVRNRARVLARLRDNLQRPVWSQQALTWRLEGFLGVRTLTKRLSKEVAESCGSGDEALLTLVDLLILLRAVNYEPVDGALPELDFKKIFDPFLDQLVGELDVQVRRNGHRLGRDVLRFWERVVQRCRNTAGTQSRRR